MTLIDFIQGEDDKSKFRQLSTELVESREYESKETIFSVLTETNNGIKPVKYNTLLWKTSWKDTPILGVRLKPIRRDSMLNGDLGNQSKEFYQNSLLSMEHKLRHLMSNMSSHSRVLQRHINTNNYQNMENDCDKFKAEIDELSKLYVYFKNIINVGNLKSLSKQEKSNFNMKIMIVNICEHVSTHCLKVNNTLKSSFSEGFPEMINSYYHAFFSMIYSFILLFNKIVQNAEIKVIAEGEYSKESDSTLVCFRFRVKMNTPKSVPPSADLLDSCENLPSMKNEEQFLVKSLIKYISGFFGNLEVEGGFDTTGNFKVSQH